MIQDPFMDTADGIVLNLRGAAHELHNLLLEKGENVLPIAVAYYAGAMSRWLTQAPLTLAQKKIAHAVVRKAMEYATTKEFSLRGSLITDLKGVIAMSPDIKMIRMFTKNADLLEVALGYMADHTEKAKGKCPCDNCEALRKVLGGNPLHAYRGKEKE